MSKRLLGFFHISSEGFNHIQFIKDEKRNKLRIVNLKSTIQNVLKDVRNILVLNNHLKGDFAMRLPQRSMVGNEGTLYIFLSGTQSVSWQNNRP